MQARPRWTATFGTLVLLGASACRAPDPPLVPEGFSSTLPVVAIESSTSIGDEPKSFARMRIDLSYHALVGIEHRGRSSQIYFPKKQFGFELRTEGDIQRQGSILGMPSESDWVLIGPYSDKSMLRDALTFELARGTGRWAPRGVFVELFLREEAPRPSPEEYQGLYLLTEKVSRGAGRVDLPRSRRRSGEDSGFILKLDWLDPDVKEAYFSTASGERILLVYPGAKDVTEPQLAYLKDFLAAFENALMGDADYTKLIDVDSFVDTMILQELAKNVDAYRSSTYLYKMPAGKLSLGPVWDFNQAYGNASYDSDATRTEGWRFQHARPQSWFTRLFRDERFFSRFASRYRELRQGALSDDALFRWIDDQAARLEEPIARNFERWPILGTVVLGNPAEPPGSHAGEIAFLKLWLEARTRWMDLELADLEERP